MCVCAFVCQGGLGGRKNRREINIVALCSANVNNAKGRTLTKSELCT